MLIPDKQLHQRVIDAINSVGVSSSASNGADKTNVISNQNKSCSCGSPSSSTTTAAVKVNVSTQTDYTEFPKTEPVTSNLPPVSNKTEFPVNIELKTETTLRKSSISSDSGMAQAQTSPNKVSATTATGKIPKKRGRKRNTCVPKVVKRSSAEMALQEREDKQLTPVTKRKKLNTTPSPILRKPVTSSCSSSPDLSFENINLNSLSNVVDNYIQTDTTMNILQTMAKEYLKAATKSEEGLLPIHDAIILNDIQIVRRQAYVWLKFKNTDLNQLLTDDDEDCLQLAIQSDSDPKIMEIILNAGILANHIYENSNTALHLAVINNIQLKSLKALMEKIDLNLLLQVNDDGYTAFHIAVRHNQYKVAEVILDSIDRRESNVVYDRPTEEINESQNELKMFSKYYENACDRLELYQEKLKRSRLKREVVNASESRAGNPPLFYAIEGEFEHLCYFLLAHLADPEEENLSGNSPKSFHYEYTRSLRISLKIGRIMDKVTNILNNAHPSSS
ncbi:receptor-interacting serine/threonine-protein kinase 4 [Drosophila tropicalis]|uniref:receptor-interacting serine/threonine-protein kinase 4 n=1 Tax=Drosophila tropicalis TaxID=46794 RepID=UPI0035ABE882